MARKPKGAGNEGEGNRSAARRYRAGVARTVERGHVGEDAERAARELEERPDELRRAEEEGKRRSAGDLPSDLRK